jgi:hypothetical protein
VTASAQAVALPGSKRRLLCTLVLTGNRPTSVVQRTFFLLCATAPPPSLCVTVTRSLADWTPSQPSRTVTPTWRPCFPTVTNAGTIDTINRLQTAGVALGADERYAWQAVQQQSVGAGVTSITVAQQTARTLAAGTATIRDITATSTKPEVSSTVNIVNVQMKQVAGVQTGIPNVYLEQPTIGSIIENDLRLSVNDGLDELVQAALAGSANQAPGSDVLLVSIRKAVTTLRASGYSPNLILLTPAASEALDVLVTGLTGGSADFVFGPAQFAPGTLFGIPRAESKVLTWQVVMDTRAHGALYLSPISLARFEESAGATNTSTVRLEGHAQYGTERTAAAIRIASS